MIIHQNNVADIGNDGCPTKLKNIISITNNSNIWFLITKVSINLDPDDGISEVVHGSI